MNGDKVRVWKEAVEASEGANLAFAWRDSGKRQETIPAEI
jgi:hypothetical protein